MEIVNCNCCGSSDYRDIYVMPDRHYHPEEFFTIVECQNCGLGFVNPRPTREEIGRYYPKSFYNYFETEQTFHERRYQSEAKYLNEITIRKGPKRLLDVGCANGGFPRYMRSLGWQVEGIEIADNSLPINDFKIYKQEFDEIPVIEPSYDAVTAWAVFEHLHDPMVYFRKAADVLKPGGLLVFLVTNFNSISSRNLFQEDIPRHLYFFTEKSVKKYLANTQFKLEQVNYSDSIYKMSPQYWLRYYIYKYLYGRKLKWKDLPLDRSTYLKSQSLANNLSSNLRYILQKPLTVLERQLERQLLRFITKWQILTKKYGIVIYTARKPT